jgi:transposase-like protein
MFDEPIFKDENEARKALEEIRWPNGPVCPHCACNGQVSRVEGTKKAHRDGLFYCNDCKGQFTVTVGTVFERSKIPLTKWWMATFMLCSSKKGVSSHQIHRTIGVTYKTAWFMTHRIREAMKDGSFSFIGGEGKTVEADETYLNKSPKTRKTGPLHARTGVQVLSLVERGGPIRSMFIDHKNVGEFLKKDSVRSALNRHLDPKSRLVTDGSKVYETVMPSKDQHEAVDHSKFEWKRGDVHTNTLEGFFSIFKRGLVGTYQHMDNKHLDRYLAEFDFRFNNRAANGVSDRERTMTAMKGIEGKRLTYRQPD